MFFKQMKSLEAPETCRSLIDHTVVEYYGLRDLHRFTAWPMQLFINISCLVQLLVRGDTQGHSWGIW